MALSGPGDERGAKEPHLRSIMNKDTYAKCRPAGTGTAFHIEFKQMKIISSISKKQPVRSINFASINLAGLAVLPTLPGHWLSGDRRWVREYVVLNRTLIAPVEGR
jgi:hypothetical protein